MKKKKNLFPVQIILSQDSLVTWPFPFLAWRFFSPLILDLRSLHIASLFPSLYYDVSLSRLSPFFYSLLLCNPTFPGVSPSFSRITPPILSYPSCVPPYCVRPHSSSMLLNFPLIILLLLKFRHSDEKQSKLQYRNTGDAVNYVGYVNKFNEFVIIYL